MCPSLEYNGCEVIAVNNALNLFGKNTSIARIIKIFEDNGIVVADSAINGVFGSNPYSLPRILKWYNINTQKVSFDDIKEEGVYIVSYWNSMDYGSKLHTVAVEVNKYGYKRAYNGDFEDISKEKYIIGYKLSN